MKQKGNVEVEIRGRLTPDQVKRLRELMASGTNPSALDRYLINFTTPVMEAEKVDLRARLTNGLPELIIKRGTWGGTARAEYAVHCQEGEFENLVAALVALGYTSGIGAHRVIHRCDIDGLELSLVHVPGHSYFYEAEIVTDEPGSAAAEIHLKHWAKQYGLPVFSKEDFLAFVDQLDAEANDVLDFTTEAGLRTVRQRAVNR